jgi:M penetrans paralogue family 26
MEEPSIFDQPRQPYNMQQPLQNGTAVLVLGILSLVICGLGLVLGIIALVLANKDVKMYRLSPEVYTAGSYNNLKAGRICAIIGLILNTLFVLFYAGIILFALSTGQNTWRY